MLDFYYRSQRGLRKMRKNYLSFYLDKAAKFYYDGKYSYSYAQRSLMFMALFGNWLKRKSISLHQVSFEHAKNFSNLYKSQNDSWRDLQLPSARHAVKLIQGDYPPPKTAAQKAFDLYAEHLRSNRGLKENSIRSQKKYVQAFLQYLNDHGIKIRSLKPVELIEYLDRLPSSPKNSSKKETFSALRGYFRFLKMAGLKTDRLIYAIPPMPCPRKSVSPSIIGKEDMKLFLKTIDRSSPIGKRTFASAHCLHGLAMRVGDVARITLDDIDWRSGTIFINKHKGAKEFKLPLSSRIGKALVDYIKHGRPVSSHREIFLRHGPRTTGTPTTGNSLALEIKKNWIKSGLSEKYSGTHIFRHSTAATMRSQGIPLKVIADVLGHDSIETTALYAQLDISALQQVTQPWPGKRGAK